jgi:hypothetical protein
MLDITVQNQMIIVQASVDIGVNSGSFVGVSAFNVASILPEHHHSLECFALTETGLIADIGRRARFHLNIRAPGSRNVEAGT